MTRQQIDKLLLTGKFPQDTGSPDLIETHISWVILCDRFVYKIKKPIRYSFLDFSTLEKRKYYCEREIVLNRRLTTGVYLGVEPVHNIDDRFSVGGATGTIIDYAVSMKRLDGARQMDRLLNDNEVTKEDIHCLAKKIAGFHLQTQTIYRKDILAIRNEFNDLDKEKDFLSASLGGSVQSVIDHAIEISDAFIEESKKHLAARLTNGYTRDCHGDLHSRNIFLLTDPQPFDCIEFNDDFRRIDVLNEIAFLCMDLDAFGRPDLSERFLDEYIRYFPVIENEADRNLFMYYKSYRANVRAKVNSLRARDAHTDAAKERCFAEVEKYLALMNNYLALCHHA